MASRSLTESFTFMRNNAFQNRQFFLDEKSGDRDALVRKTIRNNKDLESGMTSKLSGEWQSSVNSIQYTFSMIRQKMKEVIALHDRHLMNSNLDSNVDEDQEIELQTKELTQLFNLSHGQLSRLSGLRRSSMEQLGQSNKLSENIISNLARTLQDLSLAFRKAQSNYLNKLRSRDERIRSYLAVDLNVGNDQSTFGLNEFDDSNYEMWEAQKQKKSLLIDDNTHMVFQREHEINEIVKSIHELNEIFRDVAQLVVDQNNDNDLRATLVLLIFDRMKLKSLNSEALCCIYIQNSTRYEGTLVDRIDYNVENTHIRVQKGLTQLTKAQKHQSKDIKMIIILILASLVTVFGLLLIFTKLR